MSEGVTLCPWMRTDDTTRCESARLFHVGGRGLDSGMNWIEITSDG
jgi:hypothetical protein